MLNLVLSGGSGTRLWPLSRRLEPKQFYKLINNRSLLQETVIRNKPFCSQQIIALSSENYFIAEEQLDEINIHDSKYLIEPIGRNTAPAIAIACFSVNHDEIILVTPSDHMIKNQINYNRAINEAKDLAEKGFIITFGITPSYAETGYGYIEIEGNDVLKFHEKPQKLVAEEYLKKGNFYWNSGIFMFKAGVYLEELEKYQKEIYDKSKIAFENAKKDKLNQENLIDIALEDMKNIPDESIDFAVMEKSNKIKSIASDLEWSDLGSFDSLYDMLPKDDNNSTIVNNFHKLSASNDVNNINIDAKNNLIFSGNRTIVAVDIENMIIVDTPDALLITKKGSSQRVKEVVQKLKDEKSELHNIHLTVHRPWGTYTVLEEGNMYKIKKLVVKPGKKLSLQKHYHRNEHWVVVSGTAKVNLNNQENIIKSNESIFIPMGELHKLENPGKIPLTIIEVQVGEYLGEDDILRFD